MEECGNTSDLNGSRSLISGSLDGDRKNSLHVSLSVISTPVLGLDRFATKLRVGESVNPVRLQLSNPSVMF